MHYICKKKGEDTKTVNMKENSGLQLSIIIPVYQVEKYVRPCLESVYKQGLDDEVFEVIIVNDGTKDRSMEVIQDIIDQHKNITVVHQENQGLSVARNNGMAIAKGEYLLMPDSDDLLIENSVEPLLEKALETKADMVVADFVEMNDEEIKQHYHFQTLQEDDKPVFAAKTGEELLFERVVVWRTLYRKDFISDNHISFYPGITFEDNPFTLKCYLKAKLCIRAHWLLNIYRIGNTTISSPSTFNKKKNYDFSIAIREAWKLNYMEGLSPQIKKKLNDALYKIFKVYLYKIIYITPGYNNKVTFLNILRNEVPDLRFTNGIKQRTHTLLFKFFPHLYIIVLTIVKKTHWQK